MLAPKKLAWIVLVPTIALVWFYAFVRIYDVFQQDDAAAWGSYQKAIDAYEDHRFDDVERLLKKASKFAVHDQAEFHRALGTHFFYRHRCKGAVEEFRQALKMNPTLEPKLLNPLAWCYADLGELSRARTAILHLKNTYPNLYLDSDKEFLNSLEREMKVEGKADRKRVLFIFKESNPGFHRSVFLYGNWLPNGQESDVYGYQRLIMKRTGADQFELNVQIHSGSSLPYRAVVLDEQNKFLGETRLMLEPDRAMTRVLMISQKKSLDDIALRTRSKLTKRKDTADGKRRIFIFWPDGGSWWIIRPLILRGWLPNMKQMLDTGAYGDMRSEPPLTSIAIQRLTSFTKKIGIWKTVLAQLKGLQFLDQYIRMDQGGVDSLSHRLNEKGHSFVDLTFNEAYVQSPSDSSAQRGFALEDHSRYQFHPTKTDISPDSILFKYLDANRVRSFSNQQNPYGKWLLASQWDDSENKVSKALTLFQSREQPEILLLRIPGLDILSHVFFENQESVSDKTHLLEAFYVYLDDVLGRVRTTLDQDDELLLISDHGFLNVYQHSPSSLFAIEGPSIDQPGSIAPFPIERFPYGLMALVVNGAFDVRGN